VNDLIQRYREKLLNYWQQLEKGQKIKLTVTVLFLVASLVLVTALATKTKYVLTYLNLDQRTAGNIVQKLEELGIPYQLSAGGSNISVPEAESDRVKITLASEDLGGGSIYSALLEGSSFGRTDSEFDFLKKGATEEELKGLIKGIQGIDNAYVMLTIPEKKVFYSDQQNTATASVVVNLSTGVQLTPNQVQSIYNLISKSVPDLPIENITLADQYGYTLEYLQQANNSNIAAYDQQREIQQNFQKDLKRDIEGMLTGIMGADRVIVTVFAKMNFDQKHTVENIKEPVVDGKGIARSVEQIQESFSGSGAGAGGVQGTGDTQIPGYTSSADSTGDYELIEERINYDVNEITREIVSSPYSLEDLSINVVIDLPEDNDPNSATGKTKEAIQNLIKTVVNAAISDDSIDIDNKIAVVALEFEEKESIFPNNQGINPLLLYGAIGLSVLAIGGIGLSVVRRNARRRDLEEAELIANEVKGPVIDFSPVLTEEAALQKEIQKMSKQKPTEFVKLIRTWIAEE